MANPWLSHGYSPKFPNPKRVSAPRIEATMLGLRTSEGLDLAAEDDDARGVLRAIAGALQRWEESGAVEL